MTMKLELDTDHNNEFNIHSYDLDKIVVNNTTMTDRFILFPDKIIETWRPVTPKDINLDDLSEITDKKPELLLIGSGKSLVFPSNEVIAYLQSKDIGFEAMDTGAACRCFNLLVAEKRFIAAAMFI